MLSPMRVVKVTTNKRRPALVVYITASIAGKDSEIGQSSNWATGTGDPTHHRSPDLARVVV